MSLCVTIYSLFEGELRQDRFTRVEDLSQTLERLFARPNGRFAVDVSFDLLSADAIRDFLATLDCRACLSERAAPLLTEHIVADTADVGAVCGIKFYAAFPTSPFPDARVASNRGNAKGWLAGIAAADNELVRQLSAVAITDERSYQANENLLSPHLRVAVGRARYLQIAGIPPDPVDILDNLNACPPWVAGARLKDLPLTVRQANVLRAHSLRTVGELSRFGNSGLLKLPNLGLKSVRELGEIVYELLLREPAPGLKGFADDAAAEIAALPQADGSFLEMLREELRGHGGIAEPVLLERWGLLGERKTLQELADAHGVTRERIRQIEVKAAERLRGAGLWITFAQHVEGLLDSRETPLWVARLPAEDPWFGDDSSTAEGLANCVHLFLAPRLHLLEINGRLAVTTISASEWGRVIEDCKLILGNDAMDDERITRLAGAVLVEKGAELRSELVRHLGGHGEDELSADVSSSLDPDVALSRQLERALLEQTLLRTAGA